MAHKQAIVLASASPFRRELLARLQLPFTCDSPEIDETALSHEPAQELVVRLATEKAMKLAGKYPSSIIIGSDQVALLHDEILTKPGDHDSAVRQLRKASNQTVIFHTGLCVLNTLNNTVAADSIPVTVKFRKLGIEEIETYLEKEQPYNCAGSFKSEGLGVSLLEFIRGDDPSALIGLPLIRLCEILRNNGLAVP